MKHSLVLVVLAISTLMGQTPVSVLVPNTTQHPHYLFNDSYTYDQVDFTGLPWSFYWNNAATSPPPATLRTRCALEQVGGAKYNYNADIGWFRYPVPGGDGSWPAANGTYPLAATGEYLETSQFGPIGATNPIGFTFYGEFAGQASPPSSPTGAGSANFFLEAVYFTDRECSDIGTEYGWFRMVSNSYSGDTPANSATFYYSAFTNCNIDYGCWDTIANQVGSPYVTATITNLAPNAANTYSYTYKAIRSGANFSVSVLDPASGNPVSCQWSISTGGGSTGDCLFNVPIQGWYAPASVTNTGFIVVATQSSHLYPSQAGQQYPLLYDYASRMAGAAPATNIVPTAEPSGAQSCGGFACLDARSLQVLYQ
jgi:hypothetical protein